jgi:hypothetical protein
MNGNARRALGLALVSAAMLATVPACGGASEHAAAPAAAKQDPFLDRMRDLRQDYDPARTIAELSERSDQVVVGKLREIREGRIQGESKDDPARAEYLRYVFDVVETRKGTDAGKAVYVDAMKPSFEKAEVFDKAAPKGAEVVLYLRKAAAPNEGTIAPAEPLPAGAEVTRFTTPQGFLVEVDGEVVAPLDQFNSPLFPGGDPDHHKLTAWLPS